MAVTHCSRCQKQLVEGSIQAVAGDAADSPINGSRCGQVTEFLNGSQRLAKEFNMESTRYHLPSSCHRRRRSYSSFSWLRLEFLEQAFKRYDVDGSGRLDGKAQRGVQKRYDSVGVTETQPTLSLFLFPFSGGVGVKHWNASIQQKLRGLGRS